MLQGSGYSGLAINWLSVASNLQPESRNLKPASTIPQRPETAAESRKYKAQTNFCTLSLQPLIQ
jgi:hypothetical protein